MKEDGWDASIMTTRTLVCPEDRSRCDYEKPKSTLSKLFASKALYGFLVLNFRHKYSYWSLLVLFRRACIAANSVFNVSRPIFQTLVDFLFLYAALLLQAVYKPYSQMRGNRLELSSIMAQMFQTFSALIFLYRGLNDASIISTMSMLLAIYLWCFLSMLRIVVINWFHESPGCALYDFSEAVQGEIRINSKRERRLRKILDAIRDRVEGKRRWYRSWIRHKAKPSSNQDSNSNSELEEEVESTGTLAGGDRALAIDPEHGEVVMASELEQKAQADAEAADHELQQRKWRAEHRSKSFSFLPERASGHVLRPPPGTLGRLRSPTEEGGLLDKRLERLIACEVGHGRKAIGRVASEPSLIAHDDATEASDRPPLPLEEIRAAAVSLAAGAEEEGERRRLAACVEDLEALEALAAAGAALDESAVRRLKGALDALEEIPDESHLNEEEGERRRLAACVEDLEALEALAAAGAALDESAVRRLKGALDALEEIPDESHLNEGRLRGVRALRFVLRQGPAAEGVPPDVKQQATRVLLKLGSLNPGSVATTMDGGGQIDIASAGGNEAAAVGPARLSSIVEQLQLQQQHGSLR
eukprot:tig00020904_g15267.t1